MANTIWAPLTSLAVSAVVLLSGLIPCLRTHRFGPTAAPDPRPTLHRSLKVQQNRPQDRRWFGITDAPPAIDQSKRHNLQPGPVRPR